MPTKTSFLDRWNVLRQGKPGHRFRERYHRNQRSQSNHGFFWRIVRLVAAAVAFTIGVILAFIPGPAVVFFALTGALLASDWLWMARVMDWLEVKLRQLWRVGHRVWQRLPTAGRVAVVAAGVSLSAASTYGFYRLLN